MKLALSTAVVAAIAIAATSQAQGQHSAPAPAAHVSAAPAKAAPPAVRTANAHTSASHHASRIPKRDLEFESHPNIVNAVIVRSARSYTPWPAGSYFIGPVSPGGFTNPLAGTNKGYPRSKGSTGIILLGGGYGYGYAPTTTLATTPSNWLINSRTTKAPAASSRTASNSRNIFSFSRFPILAARPGLPRPAINRRMRRNRSPASLPFRYAMLVPLLWSRKPAAVSTLWLSPVPPTVSCTSRPTVVAAPSHSATSMSTQPSASIPSAARPSPFLRPMTQLRPRVQKQNHLPKSSTNNSESAPSIFRLGPFARIMERSWPGYSQPSSAAYRLPSVHAGAAIGSTYPTATRAVSSPFRWTAPQKLSP